MRPAATFNDHAAWRRVLEVVPSLHSSIQADPE